MLGWVAQESYKMNWELGESEARWVLRNPRKIKWLG